MIRNYWRRLKKWFAVNRERWLANRIPKDNLIQLNINNTFILPSTFGWSCIGIALCLFLLGTNFQNNIILFLCYFLIAIILLSIFHSYFYFIQHKICFLPIQADFENRPIYLPIQIHSNLEYKGGSLVFSIENSRIVSFQEKQTETINLSLPMQKRGQYPCPRITIGSVYGFGLFKCWTHLSPELSFLVYPGIKKTSALLHKTNDQAVLNHGSDSQYVISDDLQGIREYQQTDPMHHVSWKHVAKGQGMLSKDFTENSGVSGWLRIQDFLHLGTEDALKSLCYQVQQLNKERVQFGLDLGATKILPQEGQNHMHECLSQLALYRSEKASVSK